MVSSEKVRLTQLLREVHFFDLTRPGRLSRAAFWFIVPFETAYRLQMEPDSGFVLFWMNVFSITALAALVPLKRLAVRRLHDADFSGWWLWHLDEPCLGWLAVTVLLLLPSAPFPNRFDRFAEPEERRKQQH